MLATAQHRRRMDGRCRGGRAGIRRRAGGARPHQPADPRLPARAVLAGPAGAADRSDRALHPRCRLRRRADADGDRGLGAEARRGGTLAGLDHSPWAARYAEAQGVNARFITADLFELDPAERFDVVLCNLFTHHLRDPELVRFLRWLEDAGKPRLADLRPASPLAALGRGLGRLPADALQPDGDP